MIVKKETQSQELLTEKAFSCHSIYSDCLELSINLQIKRLPKSIIHKKIQMMEIPNI